MNKKMIFRILGALSGALIIASVFVPFVSVLGYSSSLWDTEKLTNSLYLPIVIIAFGCLISILFALNKKIEFAYTGVGAILFFVLTQTIDILRQGLETFSSLSIGYYFLVIGTILSGIMVFLMSKLNKEGIDDKEIIASSNVNNDNLFTPEAQNTLIDSENNFNQVDINQMGIDNLNNVNINQPLESVGLESQTLDQEEKKESLGENMTVGVEQSQPVNPMVQNIIPDTPVETVNVATESLSRENPVQPTAPVTSNGIGESQPVNPVVQEFSEPISTNNFIDTQVGSTNVDTNESKLNQENNNNSMDIFG